MELFPLKRKEMQLGQLSFFSLISEANFEMQDRCLDIRVRGNTNFQYVACARYTSIYLEAGDQSIYVLIVRGICSCGAMRGESITLARLGKNIGDMVCVKYENSGPTLHCLPFHGFSCYLSQLVLAV